MLFTKLIKFIWKYTHLDIFLTHMLQGKKWSIQEKLTNVETFENKIKKFVIQKFITIFSKNDIENFKCMGSIDGSNSPSIYIYIYYYYYNIYIHFKSPLLHNGCTLIVQKLYWLFLIVENLKPSPNVAYKWFYGMLMEC